MSKTQNITIKILFTAFLAGVFLFIYPFIRGAVLDFRLRDKTNNFYDTVKTYPSQTDDENTAPAETGIHHKELWDAAKAYNQKIFEEHQVNLSDSQSYAQPCLCLSDFGLEDEAFAVISIPEIETEMPVLLGASAENLSVGAAHLSQTSLPIGGVNTNCVIAGHRGWHNSRYFSRIVSLVPGDMVYIKNIWGELAYRVCETKAIESYEIDKIKIQPNKDMVTLITCYYRNKNHKMRFAVYCERVL